MPFEGAVLPQVEAEPAALGLARSPVTRSASSESNPDDCLGLGTPPIRSFAQTLFTISGLQLTFLRPRDCLRAFVLERHASQVVCFVRLAFRRMCNGFSASVLGQSHLHEHEQGQTSVGEDAIQRCPSIGTRAGLVQRLHKGPSVHLALSLDWTWLVTVRPTLTHTCAYGRHRLPFLAGLASGPGPPFPPSLHPHMISFT